MIPPPPEREMIDDLMEEYLDEFNKMKDVILAQEPSADRKKINKKKMERVDKCRGSKEADHLLEEIRTGKDIPYIPTDPRTRAGEEEMADNPGAYVCRLKIWLNANANLSNDNLENLTSDEIIRLSKVLHNYTHENGEFKRGHEDAVTSEWFEIKAEQSRKRVQAREDRTTELLEMIKADWRYRIKEVIKCNGDSVFIPQQRHLYTFGIWQESTEYPNLSQAVDVVGRWMKTKVKDTVKIHGVEEKKIRGDRNDILRGLKGIDAEVMKRIHAQYDSGPPRKRPPPMDIPGKRTPPPPPPPKPRVIKEGVPHLGPPRPIPPPPQMPPNESIGIVPDKPWPRSEEDEDREPSADDLKGCLLD